jgi:hypothetical protein
MNIFPIENLKNLFDDPLRIWNSPILLIRMPFAAFNDFDLRDKLKIIREGNYYSVRDIFTDCYYPIMIPLLERWVRMV